MERGRSSSSLVPAAQTMVSAYDDVDCWLAEPRLYLLIGSADPLSPSRPLDACGPA